MDARIRAAHSPGLTSIAVTILSLFIETKAAPSGHNRRGRSCVLGRILNDASDFAVQRGTGGRGDSAAGGHKYRQIEDEIYFLGWQVTNSLALPRRNSAYQCCEPAPPNVS